MSDTQRFDPIVTQAENTCNLTRKRLGGDWPQTPYSSLPRVRAFYIQDTEASRAMLLRGAEVHEHS